MKRRRLHTFGLAITFLLLGCSVACRRDVPPPPPPPAAPSSQRLAPPSIERALGAMLPKGSLTMVIATSPVLARR